MKKLTHHVYLVLSGVVEILEGIVKVFSLGFVIPTWSFDLIAWWSKRKLTRKQS